MGDGQPELAKPVGNHTVRLAELIRQGLHPAHRAARFLEFGPQTKDIGVELGIIVPLLSRLTDAFDAELIHLLIDAELRAVLKSAGAVGEPLRRIVLPKYLVLFFCPVPPAVPARHIRDGKTRQNSPDLLERNRPEFRHGQAPE